MKKLLIALLFVSLNVQAVPPPRNTHALHPQASPAASQPWHVYWFYQMLCWNY